MTNIYTTIYQLLESILFGSVTAGTYPDMICVMVSTFACLFMIAVPFIVVYKVIQLIVGR